MDGGRNGARPTDRPEGSLFRPEGWTTRAGGFEFFFTSSRSPGLVLVCPSSLHARLKSTRRRFLPDAEIRGADLGWLWLNRNRDGNPATQFRWLCSVTQTTAMALPLLTLTLLQNTRLACRTWANKLRYRLPHAVCTSPCEYPHPSHYLEASAAPAHSLCLTSHCVGWRV